jgi:hypothetical protein
MEITEAISVFFLGAIIFVPVAALSARFAMKPILSLLNRRFATEDLSVEVATQRRRIEALENELADMHESLRSVSATADFDRRLSAPDAPPEP